MSFDYNAYHACHVAQSRGVDFPEPIPRLVCADGLTLSVQASAVHYCTPREDAAWYWAVEVGFPTVPVPELLPYAEDADRPTKTVYGYVPVELVEQIITTHGGIAAEATP